MPSQEALYGPLLTSKQQYKHDVQSEPPLTQEEQTTLLALAFEGDQQARSVLIVRHLADYVQYWAGRYARAYAWASARLEYADLVQEGNIIVLEKFDLALKKENPLAYLKGCVKLHLWRYCHRYASAILTPDHEEGAYPVDSLDAPIPETDEGTLADLLENKTGNQSEAKDFTLLYKAIGLLAKRQQEVIRRFYGMDCAPEDLMTISRSIAEELGNTQNKSVPGAAYAAYEHALVALRKKLTDPVLLEEVPCECGCGRMIARMSTTGQTKKYFSKACAARALRVRRNPVDPQEVIACACGCGKSFTRDQSYGGRRAYYSRQCAQQALKNKQKLQAI